MADYWKLVISMTYKVRLLSRLKTP